MSATDVDVPDIPTWTGLGSRPAQIYNLPFGLTGEQIRAARAFLRADQKTLAVEAGVSLETIKRLEKIRGPIEANSRTIHAIQNAFLKYGLVFNDHERADVIFRRISPPAL